MLALGNDLVAVDGLAHGLAHDWLVEWVHGRVRAEEEVADRVDRLEVLLRVLLHETRLVIGHEDGVPVDRARTDGQSRARVGGVGQKVQGADLRKALLPVVRVAHEGELLGGEGTDRVRPCTDRVVIDVGDGAGDALPDVLGDDQHLADVEQLGVGGRGEPQDRLCRRRSAGAGEGHAVAVEGRVLLHEVEREGDVRCAEGLAVAPLDARAGVQDELGAVVRPRPRGRQPRVDLADLQQVELHERFVDHGGRALEVGRVRERERVEPSCERPRRVGDDVEVAAPARPLRRRRAGGRGRGQKGRHHERERRK